LYDTHHGLTNAVVMPYVLAFNRDAIAVKLTRLAAWLGLPNPGFDALQNWVLDLRRTIGIPHTLKELGVGTERLDELAEMAAVDPTASGNPVPVGVAELRRMFVACIEGQLN
jgi:alcohol dehydrogenase class IV